MKLSSSRPSKRVLQTAFFLLATGVFIASIGLILVVNMPAMFIGIVPWLTVLLSHKAAITTASTLLSSLSLGSLSAAFFPFFNTKPASRTASPTRNHSPAKEAIHRAGRYRIGALRRSWEEASTPVGSPNASFVGSSLGGGPIRRTNTNDFYLDSGGGPIRRLCADDFYIMPNEGPVSGHGASDFNAQFPHSPMGLGDYGDANDSANELWPEGAKDGAHSPPIRQITYDMESDFERAARIVAEKVRRLVFSKSALVEPTEEIMAAHDIMTRRWSIS